MYNKGKYGAKKIEADGLTFDSKKEYARWCELKLLEKAKEISGLQRQVAYELIPSQRGEEPQVHRKGDKLQGGFRI